MEYTQDDNLLIQCYFTTAFLTELKNNNFLDSEYYKNANFEDNFVKKNLPKVGIDNQGTLLIFLYTMLVVPKQLIGQDFPNEFAELNIKVDQIKSDINSTYLQDSEKIDYIRHIRNAVAHARLTFIPNEAVTFTDENNRREKCTITIPLNNVGLFLTELQKVFMKYIEKLKTKSNTYRDRDTHR
ncbi:MAG: hypothetical protein LWX08_15305 [Deltaproteobacteria bacterium]|nr:hypothetical protein [Deltaproteobacteria bacterium]